MRKNVITGLSRLLSGAIILLIAMLAIQCHNNNNHNNKPVNQVSQRTLSPAALLALHDKMSRGVVDTSIPKTIISFKEKNFDFGNLKSGDVVTHTFIFTNSSTNPLVIYNVQGTCGCTVPHWTIKPVSPGDTGHITIQYNSVGEGGLQNKKVRVFTNTKPMENDIFFTANVKQ